MIVSLIVFIVIFHGFMKKIDVYDCFIEGAREGIVIIKNMFPSILAMIFVVNIFINSGVVSYVFSFLKPLFSYISVPFEIVPTAILRPLSGSFGLGILNNLYKDYGPDSFISLLASVIQGSSDTTVYIISLYFGTIGIKKGIRWVLLRFIWEILL